jgi:hypothetical protein
VPLLFAVAILVNAALLFAVQPMVAKMLLPVLGGTPAVWNTCMVFFQAALLCGYAFAHALTSRWPRRVQTAAYPLLQVAGFVTLPLAVGEHSLRTPPWEAIPVPWLLGALAVTVGLPFFLLAATGPVLQKWFAGTDSPGAEDPYFLYAASNLGSLGALLAYPLLMEPALTLCEQSRLWTAGYGALVLLTAGCAAAARRRSAVRPAEGAPGCVDEAPTVGRRLRWVALAAVPSSLLLGVTTYVTTDIATIPLLWVVPLALYLLTFTLAFARRPPVPHRLAARLVPAAAAVLTVLLLCRSMEPPVGLWVGLHLGAFAILALYCHGELARDRPPPGRLTEFYLWLAAGGVLGGAFNALVAPLVFRDVWEYPLALVAACLLRRSKPAGVKPGSRRRLDWLLPAGLGVLTVLLIATLRGATALPLHARLGLMFGLPGVLCFLLADRPLRFALGVAAVFLAAALIDGDPQGRALYAERSFFGVRRITEERDHPGRFYQLVHGNTVHGRQRQDPTGRPEPLSYYHPTGPIGQVFHALSPRWENAQVGVIGLGVGALAWYAEPGQEWTFYEIDPAVKRIAENTAYFRFLSTCRAPYRIDLGDARLRLREAEEGSYDLLVLDAFSSDAVPVHLLTREALRLYLEKLKPEGVLAFHLSNRYLDLKRVAAALAADAGLACLYQDDFDTGPDDSGNDPSQWVVMARSASDFGALARGVRWAPPQARPGMRVWTDDFSNLLGVVRWHEE